MEEKNPFNKWHKTVWVMSLILTALFTYLLIKASTVGVNDSRLYDSISFGSTLVSIVLAVIAIIYTLVQGVAQKNDSTNLSTQISVMSESVHSFRSSNADFSQKLESLREIMEKVKEQTAPSAKSQELPKTEESTVDLEQPPIAVAPQSDSGKGEGVE